MPSLSVHVDGALLARVRTDSYEVLQVQVHGARIEEEFAMVEMSGGSYPEGKESTYHIWVNSVPLQAGQEVEVVFDADGETSHPGRTIDQLFPGETGNSQPEDFRPTSEMFEALRAKPILREGYSLTLFGPDGVVFDGHTDSTTHGFGFSVVWNSFYPERANLSLHSYTLDNLKQGTPFSDHVCEYIEPVWTSRLRVAALPFHREDAAQQAGQRL